MPVYTVLIVGAWIGEIVSDSCHRGKFMTGFLIEVGIADAAVDRAMTDAETGKQHGVVSADGNTAHAVNHEVIRALVPFQRILRIKITKPANRVRNAVGRN